MSEKSFAATSVLSELVQVGSYKRNQGKTVRLVTALVFGLVFALAAWQVYELSESNTWGSLLAAVVFFGGAWFSYRIVHWPKFADFLIAVEAEMSKVSWPTQTELVRSSIVVIFLIFALAALLFGFDLFWGWVFRSLGVLTW